MTKRQSKKRESKNETKPKETKVEFLASLAGVLATGLFIITFMVQAFAIPSSSMESTSQTMLRHAKPDTTAIYTHGNFGKALDAQRVYMEQLLRMKAASRSTQ
jgi:hypothetical protein